MPVIGGSSHGAFPPERAPASPRLEVYMCISAVAIVCLLMRAARPDFAKVVVKGAEVGVGKLQKSKNVRVGTWSRPGFWSCAFSD